MLLIKNNGLVVEKEKLTSETIKGVSEIIFQKKEISQLDFLNNENWKYKKLKEYNNLDSLAYYRIYSCYQDEDGNGIFNLIRVCEYELKDLSRRLEQTNQFYKLIYEERINENEVDEFCFDCIDNQYEESSKTLVENHDFKIVRTEIPNGDDIIVSVGYFKNIDDREFNFNDLYLRSIIDEFFNRNVKLFNNVPFYIKMEIKCFLHKKYKGSKYRPQDILSIELHRFLFSELKDSNVKEDLARKVSNSTFEEYPLFEYCNNEVIFGNLKIGNIGYKNGYMKDDFVSPDFDTNRSFATFIYSEHEDREDYCCDYEKNEIILYIGSVDEPELTKYEIIS